MGNKLKGSTIELDWSSVFSWKGAGHLLYVVYVGSEVGAANIITGECLFGFTICKKESSNDFCL